MTEYWPTAREPVSDTGSIGVVRHRPHRIIRHKHDDHVRRIVTALTVGALAAGIVSTTAHGIAVRDADAPAAHAVGDPAPVGVEPEYAQTAARAPQSADTAAGEGSGTGEGVEPAQAESRASQIAADNARADRSERPEPTSATSVPPAASVAASPEPSVTPNPSGSSSASPSPSATPDPSSSTSDSDVSPSTVAPDPPEPSVTGSESAKASTGNYGTCVPRVDRLSRSSVRTPTCASGNHLRSSGFARRR